MCFIACVAWQMTEQTIVQLPLIRGLFGYWLVNIDKYEVYFLISPFGFADSGILLPPAHLKPAWVLFSAM